MTVSFRHKIVLLQAFQKHELRPLYSPLSLLVLPFVLLPVFLVLPVSVPLVLPVFLDFSC